MGMVALWSAAPASAQPKTHAHGTSKPSAKKQKLKAKKHKKQHAQTKPSLKKNPRAKSSGKK